MTETQRNPDTTTMELADVKVWKVTGKLGDQRFTSVMLGADERAVLELHVMEWTWGTHDDDPYQAKAEMIGIVRMPMARSDDGQLGARFVQPDEQLTILDQLAIKS